MHAVKRLVLLYIIVLSASSSKALVSIDHSFSHLDFHKFWHSMTSSHVITEVKQQWARLVLRWVTVWMYSLMNLFLSLNSYKIWYTACASDFVARLADQNKFHKILVLRCIFTISK